MKVERVIWHIDYVEFLIDGAVAICDTKRPYLEHGFAVLTDSPDGVLGYWEDVLTPKRYVWPGCSILIPSPCEDPVVVAEARLHMAVTGFGEDVEGVDLNTKERTPMTAGEAKAALRAGLWGFQKLRIP